MVLPECHAEDTTRSVEEAESTGVQQGWTPALHEAARKLSKKLEKKKQGWLEAESQTTTPHYRLGVSGMRPLYPCIVLEKMQVRSACMHARAPPLLGQQVWLLQGKSPVMRYAMGTLKVYPTKERDEEDGIQNHEREPRMDHVMPMLPGFGALVREGQRLIEKHMGASPEQYDAKFERVSCKNTGTNNRLGLPGRVRQGDRRRGAAARSMGRAARA